MCKILAAVEDSLVEATLLHLPTKIADMVTLQRLTGMRPGELVKLETPRGSRSTRTVGCVPARWEPIRVQQLGRPLAVAAEGQTQPWYRHQFAQSSLQKCEGRTHSLLLKARLTKREPMQTRGSQQC